MSGDGETAQGCSGCGLLAPGGTAGCAAAFHEMVARDFSDALRFRVHRMLVDTYSLQHPDRYCASARSFAAHLTGLCAILESGASRAVGDEQLRRWLDGNVRLQRPDTPRFRGELTIAHVREAVEPEACAAAVEEWALSTWEAYSALQPLARRWIQKALAGQRPPLVSRSG
jgi:Family of unknown function (DUF5946)